MRLLPAVVIATVTLPVALPAAVTSAGFVWNANRNWAPMGVASQSTTGFGGVASRGNDGNTNGNFGGNSVTHTDGSSTEGWWEVDLGTSRPVDQIVVWNRTDCCGERLNNFSVTAYNAANAVVWTESFGGQAGVSQAFSPTAGLFANRIRVSHNPGNPEGSLSLAEVQVLSLFTPVLSNVAPTGSASQSSTGYGGDATRAIDGNTDGFWGNNSVTHTDDTVASGSPIWWEVALPQDHFINEIAIHNRADCCGDRLSNFRVSVFDGATETWGSDYFVGAGSAGGVFSIRDESGAFFTAGDRVRIQYVNGFNNLGDNPSGKSLSLAEVQIFGTPVPEPGTAAMVALAALATLRRRRA